MLTSAPASRNQETFAILTFMPPSESPPNRPPPRSPPPSGPIHPDQQERSTRLHRPTPKTDTALEQRKPSTGDPGNLSGPSSNRTQGSAGHSSAARYAGRGAAMTRSQPAGHGPQWPPAGTPATKAPPHAAPRMTRSSPSRADTPTGHHPPPDQTRRRATAARPHPPGTPARGRPAENRRIKSSPPSHRRLHEEERDRGSVRAVQRTRHRTPSRQGSPPRPQPRGDRERTCPSGMKPARGAGARLLHRPRAEHQASTGPLPA